MENNTNREGNMTSIEQITAIITNSLIEAINSGATIEQAFAAHAEDIFNKYPGIAAAITEQAA